MVAVGGLGLAIYAALLFRGLPDAAELAEYRPPTSTRVYAWDGTLIAQLGQERRIFTPYDQIPPLVIRAFLAAEDHKFFEHGGIDVEGLGRAMSRDVFRAANKQRLQGGSTITQQVAKNILLTNEQTFGRKVKEAILAQRIEQTLPKSRILEIYLNQIGLGNRAYGVGAAAYNYFGKTLGELDLAQIAFLAACPRGRPTTTHHPQGRRHRAAQLDPGPDGPARLGRDGPAVQAAMQEDLVVQTKPERTHYRDADYFVEEVRQRAKGTISKTAENDGLYLRTTLDSRLQSAARMALMKGLESYDRRHGWRGPWGHTDVSPDWAKAADVKPAPAERRTWDRRPDRQGGRRRGRHHHRQGRDRRHHRRRRGLGQRRQGAAAGRPGLCGAVNPGSKFYNLRQVPAVNGALVVIEPKSGRVLALVGGYSFSLSNFNRATQAARQPGSSFKPFVYATALENGFTPASTVLDAPIYLNGGGGKVYSPENYEHTYSGQTPLRNGLVFSKNTMTVRLAKAVGMHKIVDAAARFGVADHLPPYLPAALGAGEVTPFRLTAAYSEFANGGKRIQPHLIELAEDHTGQVVWKADRRDCPDCGEPFDGEESPRIPPDGTQVMDPITAYAMTLMLEGVTQVGTGAEVGKTFGARPIAGKTGTTNDYRSAWFVGYTPDLVVGAFVGFDDNRSLGDKETGAKAAIPIWIDFMQDALKDQPVTDFTAPPGREDGLDPRPQGGLPPRHRAQAAAPQGAPRVASPSAIMPPTPYGQAFPSGAAPTGASPPKPPPKDVQGLY